MKVGGSSGVASAQGPAARGATSAPAGGFSVPDASAATEAAPASQLVGATGVGSIDALLALQGVASPLERRRKAVRRAGVLLDVLDDLKVALLDGGVPSQTLGRLIEAIRQERAQTGDAKLEDLLDEIETRAAVELAKLDPSSAA
ncbi:MAG TPA: flagellar assembly protein FliX [Caulobacteraceae bacterium]|nr:flagellar assembly protein FliX [Caulobacteraceae bacterium]